MEIDYTKERVGSHRAPEPGSDPEPDPGPEPEEDEVPAQRVDSPSMPIRVPPAPKGKSTPPAEKKPATPRRWGMLLVPLAIIGVLGLVAGAVYLIPGSIDNAKTGDCASYDRSNAQSPYATVRCGSSAAVFTVLQVIEGEGRCKDVAGASRSTTSTANNTRREVCMGPKDVNPVEAVNAAQAGDCLSSADGDERRVSCTDPAATSRILLRVNDVSTTQVPSTCEKVPGATSVYSWSWDNDDGTGPAQASYQTDAVFCLGAVS